MNMIAMQKSLRSARMTRNAAMLGLVSSFTVNLFLSHHIFTQSSQVVLVPSTVSDGMVARGAYDKRYLQALAFDAVFAIYNVTPDNVDFGRTTVSRLSSVADREKILRHYDEVALDIVERDISTVFFIETIEHTPNGQIVIVEGDLRTYVNNVFVETLRRRILLEFIEEAGSTRLSKISKLEVES